MTAVDLSPSYSFWPLMEVTIYNSDHHMLFRQICCFWVTNFISLFARSIFMPR